jgi:hypothetical protein
MLLRSVAFSGALALGGCAAVLPSGPDVVGSPSGGKDVAQFRQDDAACRSDAGQQIRAEIGVGAPLSFQQRYDRAYAQCLASKGDVTRPVRTAARDACGDDDPSRRGPLRCAGPYPFIAAGVR